MAFEGPQITLVGVTASVDLSTHQYKLVKMTGAKTVGLCTAVTDKVVGVLQNTPISGLSADVCAFGVSKVVVGSAVTAGDTVGADVNGRAVTYVEGTDTTKYKLGTVVEASGALGGLATVLVTLGGRLA